MLENQNKILGANNLIVFSVVSLICPVVNMLLLVKCSYIPRKVGFVIDKYNGLFCLHFYITGIEISSFLSSFHSNKQFSCIVSRMSL